MDRYTRATSSYCLIEQGWVDRPWYVRLEGLLPDFVVTMSHQLVVVYYSLILHVFKINTVQEQREASRLYPAAHRPVRVST